MTLSANAALAKDRATGKSVQMQHRHFAYIANMIAVLPCEIREQVAKTFAGSLRLTNDNFDLGRFLRACNLDLIEYETILRDQESMA
jgi:hypothetical protein